MCEGGGRKREERMHLLKFETAEGNMVHDVKWECNGKRFATASSNSTVKIMGLTNNSVLQLLTTLTGHQGPVMQVAWGGPKFGSVLASCSLDGGVIIWKESSQNEWKEFYVFNEHKASVNCLSWAPHELGLCLACGSSDGSISVLTARSDGSWDTNLIDHAHPGGVTCLSWAPATASRGQHGSMLRELNHKLASGGCDSTMKVWKLCNGTWKMDCYPEVEMHSDPESDVTLAPNAGLPKTTNPSTLDTPNFSAGEGRHCRWQLEEDELLIRAWLDCYKDPNAVKDKKMPSYWNRVAKYFEESRRGGVLRTELMLLKRWHRISLQVKKFVECYDQAYHQCHSEADNKDIVTRAHRLYSSQNDGCHFNLVHAWILLKDERKWKAYVNLFSCEDCSKKIEVSESHACRSEFNPDTLTSMNVGSSEVCNIAHMAESCSPDHVHKPTSRGSDNTKIVSKVLKKTRKTNCLAATQTHLDSAGDVARAPNPGLSLLTMPSTSEADAIPCEGRNRWYHEDDELLIRAWLCISKDPVVRNDQKMSPFWDRVTKYFEENRKGEAFRTSAQLKDRWHRVSRPVKKFVECYDEACRECQSELNEDVLVRAHRIYRLENDDCLFNLEHAWILLKDESVWRSYVSLPNCKGCSKRLKVSEYGACVPSSTPADIPTSEDIGAFEDCDIYSAVNHLESDVELSGQEKSGVLVKELHPIKSAELKKASALEDLARTKQMEIDMRMIFKDTSSMNKYQKQFHVLLVQQLKQKYLL